jgi:hypothetical protein
MEPGFTYRVDNQELIYVVREDFYSNPTKVKENRGKQNYEKFLGTIKEHDIWNFGKWFPYFWENHRELYDYLNKITYPQDPRYSIDKTWVKYYPEGSFSGLHIEYGGEGTCEDQHTNVILIDQAEDIMGGIIILAGDSYEINFKDPNTKGNLRERLLTRFLKNPGDAITWDEKAVHGVSKIEKGHRLVLVCTKIKMERQNG